MGALAAVALAPPRPRARASQDVRELIRSLDGLWTGSGAREALSEWLRLGAERERAIDLVVCQNDAMAEGARDVLTEHAGTSGRGELATVPVIGCDGLEDEGQALVTGGRITATVVMPVTASAALATLRRYWDEGERPGETVVLEATSFPPLEPLRAP
jgi:ABC-type sugar transport system substrate-binding protein